jgi:hypothetical protein
MNISVTITRPPSIAFGEVTDDKRKLVTDSVRRVGEMAQRRLRQQVISSFRGGQRLANTWRLSMYPGFFQPSLGSTAVIFSKAPNIIRAFDAGEVIGPKNARYLAIPLPAAGPASIGGTRITPRSYAQRTGLRLAFVERPGKSALLVANPPRGGTGARARPVAVFVLVPQITPRKRLDLDGVARQASEDLARAITAGLGVLA